MPKLKTKVGYYIKPRNILEGRCFLCKEMFSNYELFVKVEGFKTFQDRLPCHDSCLAMHSGTDIKARIKKHLQIND